MRLLDPARAARCTRRLAVPTVTLAAALLTACEVVTSDDRAKRGKQDTTTLAPSAVPATTPAVTGGDTGGVTALPSDSAVAAAAAPDTGVVLLHPTRPRRGGVLFAFAQGLAVPAPRCTWKGVPLPCYRVNGGVLATVPLPAGDSAGTYVLTIDRPGGRLTREVTVDEREFGRELVFLDSATYARITDRRAVAREARVLRGLLSGETPDRQWSGRWREPVPLGGATGYGVERLYYPASDSSRAIRVGDTGRPLNAFATDTAMGKEGDVPGWRHAGVDVALRRGTPVVAPAAGTVADVGDYLLSGHTVLVDHGQGVYSAYFHLDTVLVRRGELVRPGRTLGQVGATGLATGSHLHYSIYVHGVDVDPAAWRDMPAFARGDTTARMAARDDTVR